MMAAANDRMHRVFWELLTDNFRNLAFLAYPHFFGMGFSLFFSYLLLLWSDYVLTLEFRTERGTLGNF